MKYMKYMLAVLACAGIANAELINLSDASLEASFSGSFGTPESGWNTFGSAQSAVQVDSGFWAIGNNHGANAVYAVNIGDADGGSIYQTVELDAGVTYRFTAAIAQAASVNKNDGRSALVVFTDGFGSLEAQTTGVVANQSGTFVDDYVEYTPTATGLYNVGMRNRGVVVGSGANNGESTIFFDNARLEVIPEPATMGLVAVFGGAVLFIRRRLMI